VARRERGVVEEWTPGDHARRLGVVQSDMRDLRARDGVDDRDRVVEAGQRIDPVRVLVEHQAGQAAAGHSDLIRGARREGVVLQSLGVEDSDLGRAKRGYVQGPAVARDRHLLRQREALVVLGVRDRVTADGVIDVLVEMPRSDAASRAEDGDPAFVEMAADAVAGEGAGTLETFLVAGFGVRDIDLPVHRVHHHVVEDGADALIVPGGSGELRRRIGVRVEDEDVLVGQGEADLVVPGPVELVDPVGAIEPDDEPRLRPRNAVGVGIGSGQASRGLPAVRDERLVDRRRPIPGVERRRIDLAAVRRHRQSARRVAEQGDHGERRSGERGAEMIRIENPDVRPAHAGSGELGIERNVLAAMSRGDEGAVPARSGEHDVARLIADEQGAHDVSAVPPLAELDDADAVGEMVDHPDLGLAARRDGHRLEADRDGDAMPQSLMVDVKDFEAIVGRIDREESPAAGG